MLLQLFNSLQLLCPVLETWKFVNTIPKRKRFRNPRTNNIWFLPSQEKEFQRQKSRNIWGSVFWIPDGLKSAINKSLPELMKIKFLHQVLFSSEIVKKKLIHDWMIVSCTKLKTVNWIWNHFTRILKTWHYEDVAVSISKFLDISLCELFWCQKWPFKY